MLTAFETGSETGAEGKTLAEGFVRGSGVLAGACVGVHGRSMWMGRMRCSRRMPCLLPRKLPWFAPSKRVPSFPLPSVPRNQSFTMRLSRV